MKEVQDPLHHPLARRSYKRDRFRKERRRRKGRREARKGSKAADEEEEVGKAGPNTRGPPISVLSESQPKYSTGLTIGFS